MKHKIQVSLTSIILTSFLLYIVTFYLWGASPSTLKYSQITFFLLIGLLLLFIIQKHTFLMGYPFFAMGIFVTYTYSSYFWSIDQESTFVKAKTLTLLWFMLILLWNFFSRFHFEEYIIKVLLIAGLALSIYIVYYYGVSEYILGLFSGKRMGQDINNVNAIGLQTGIATVICVYYAIYKEKKIFYLWAIFPLMITFGTGSRKAFFLVICGVTLLFLLGTQAGNRTKMLAGFMAFFLIFAFVIQLPAFDLLNDRMEGLINLFTGQGEVDYSSLTRQRMIAGGIEQFKETPILGIGLGNSGYISREYVGRFTYLHNNFVELLATSGLVGFFLYYSMFIYVLIVIFPKVRLKDETAIITFIILFMQIIMDYGSVSYYSKTTYIYLLLGFLVSRSGSRNREIII